MSTEPATLDLAANGEVSAPIEFLTDLIVYTFTRL
jgi:hypothetical protein